jgi:hypothetical protein
MVELVKIFLERQREREQKNVIFTRNKKNKENQKKEPYNSQSYKKNKGCIDGLENKKTLVLCKAEEKERS